MSDSAVHDIVHDKEPIRLFKSDFLEFFTHIHKNYQLCSRHFQLVAKEEWSSRSFADLENEENAP